LQAETESSQGQRPVIHEVMIDETMIDEMTIDEMT
jgi:hypothetical protein